MSTIISRIGHCDKCARSGSPRTGELFLAYGSKHNTYKVMEAQRNGCIGFVPHIYKLKARRNNDLVIEVSCAVHLCGVDKKWLTNDGVWYFYVKEFRQEVWTVERWNALVTLKHNWFTKQYEI